MDKSSLKISIITVCFNASNTIEETIISVVKQTYKNIEYIIIDGGSSDQTNNINIVNLFLTIVPNLMMEFMMQ